jgi:alpha-glucosidase
MRRRTDMTAPDDADWWKRAVFYQIYPRSFFDSDGDGVGDLKGIETKLDYIASLGVDAIWLSPFFTSPMKDFGYDVSDYRGVDPLFGTLAAFDDLLAGVHARGMKLIIDQVWSHTSDQHPWFRESAASRDNPKTDWYVWADAKPDGTAPNNWMAVFGGPSWSWGPRRRQYYLHNFLVEQPDLNYWNAEVQDAILDVARFWLDRGVDGFRLDVINFIVHDRRLRDNPPADHERPPAQTGQFQIHVQDRSQPEALAFLSRLRSLIDSYGDRMTLGEVADYSDLERQQEYVEPPDRLHTAYSFHLLLSREATPALFAHALTSWAEAKGWPSWSLGNHDVERFATRLVPTGDPRQVRALMSILLALRGTPFIYQGEELGLPQAQVPFERLKDPYAIAFYAGSPGRDGARTPMPWRGDDANAGFSSAAETWLPVDPRHRALAVAEQERDPGSMLGFTRALIALRKRTPALQLGDAKVLDAPAGVLAFERRLGEVRLLCAFELSGAPASLAVEPVAETLLAISGASLTDGRLDLPPFAAAILRLEP